MLRLCVVLVSIGKQDRIDQFVAADKTHDADSFSTAIFTRLLVFTALG
jgi:hypothetical protein